MPIKRRVARAEGRNVINCKQRDEETESEKHCLEVQPQDSEWSWCVGSCLDSILNILHVFRVLQRNVTMQSYHITNAMMQSPLHSFTSTPHIKSISGGLPVTLSL
jgi:hypothetical protein